MRVIGTKSSKLVLKIGYESWTAKIPPEYFQASARTRKKMLLSVADKLWKKATTYNPNRKFY